MAIQLNTNAVLAKTHSTGDDSFYLTESQTLKIETTPHGEDVYEGTVPVGKVWEVRMYLQIDEINPEDVPEE